MIRLSNALALALATLILAAAPGAQAGLSDWIGSGWLKPERHDELHFGERTRDWLQLQRSGRSDAPARNQDPEASKRARQRYLRSFEHPIPDSFVDRADGGSDK